MRELASKVQVRTPIQLAKNAMKQEAIREFEIAGLETHARVTIEYMGTRHVLEATPTVSAKSGQVLFHCGAVGRNKLAIADGFSLGVGTNLFTGKVIDQYETIMRKYGLTPGEASVDLDAGESTD